MNVEKLVSDYYKSYEYKQLRDETKKQYQYFIDAMLNTKCHSVTNGGGETLLRQLKCKDVTTKMAKTAYNDWCERGIPTANHIMACARIVFSHGMREELCLTNPFSVVQKRASERRKVLWGREDVQRFLDVAYSDFNTRNIGLIAHMAYEWCQRLGDMRVLQWDNIDFDTQTVHIEQSKRRADVHLPISDELCEMLKQQEEDFGFQPYVAPSPFAVKGAFKPYTIKSLPTYGRKIMDKAGLSRELRLSDLRRTGTTEMVEAGVGIAQIMSVTGHANPQSVKPYLKNTLKSANFALTERKKHDTSTS